MIAKIWNFSGWISTTKKNDLTTLFNQLLKEAGFNVLNYVEHDFKPQGYTGLWLLAESHFAIHTFPENGETYIELSSCNEVKQAKFLELLCLENCIFNIREHITIKK